jgi:uncharacterized protein (DUF1501 family)
MNLKTLRASLIPKKWLTLDNFFAFHPNLPNLFAMFANGEALAVHAVGPIVDTRSHFVGQDYLQGGGTTLLSTGWLNRALSMIGYTGPLQPGMSLGPVAPAVIHGSNPIAGWNGDPFPVTSGNLETVMQTDCSNDAAIGPVMSVAFQDRDVFTAILQGHKTSSTSTLVRLAEVAGYCLASPYGPAVAVLQTDSFDTHYQQNTRLPTALSELDQAIAGLKSALGTAWTNTVVLTMTEFGRTAYANGTSGTDHGTGFAVLLAGGAVAGGRVVVENGWPGLGKMQLFDGRDLAPTCQFQQVAMGVLFDHMGISSSNQEILFPGSTALGLTPLGGLVKG